MSSYSAERLMELLIDAPPDKVREFLAAHHAEEAEIYEALAANPDSVAVEAEWTVYRDQHGKDLQWSAPSATYRNRVAQLTPGGRIEAHDGDWYVVTDATWLPRPDKRCEGLQEAKLRAATKYLLTGGDSDDGEPG